MIKLLFCVDDIVLLKSSIFSEMNKGYDRMLSSNRVGYYLYYSDYFFELNVYVFANL